MTTVEPPERPQDEPEGRVSPEGPNEPVNRESEERLQRLGDGREESDESEEDDSSEEDE